MHILSAGRFALALGVLLPCAAEAREDTQYWPSALVNVNLGGDFKASEEVITRFSEARGLYEIESNLMVGRKLDKHISVWIGYTHDPNYLRGQFVVMEHRAREQVSFDNIQRVGRATISGRLRLEERWREGSAGTGIRLRPFAKASLPLGAATRTSLVVTHESYVDFNTSAFQATSGFDRMRNFVGIDTPLVKHITLEGGYLNQYAPGKSGHAIGTVDHVVMLGLIGNF